jgi:hypothetical protein
MYFLKPLLFSVIACGFNPLIALERTDSSENRLTKIKGFIESSQNSIHILSRVKSIKAGEYYRLNMPFEIGLDFGCKSYLHKEKRILILEEEKYSYQKAISDLSGVDVISYKRSENSAEEEDAEELVIVIRNWLSELRGESLLSGSEIWDSYNTFLFKLETELRETKKFRKRDIEALPVREFLCQINSHIPQINNHIPQ